MKHFLSIDGNVSLREARMMHIGLQPGAENPQPNELPQGPQRIDMRADQVTEDLLRGITDRVTGAQEKTNETATSHLDTIAAGVQRNLDAIYSSPNVSQQFVKEYLDSVNQELHPKRLHASAANRQARISPYNPRQFPPEQIAKKNRINELQGQINQVDRNIRELMNGFRQNAVQYRGQKTAAMNRGNIAPEINQMLMQFPQASMQASAGPLNQLYALKFRLQQELAGVKSGVIKVPVPGQGGEQDPSLINSPRYGAMNADGTRFDLAGAPGGIGPDGLPLPNALPDAATQAAILRLSERWRGTNTQEERDTVEGFLMMDGVDVDSSDLQHDTIVMVSPEEKGMQFLVGLIMVIKSLLDRFAKKKTAIEGSDVSEKDLSTMTEEERTTETEANTKKLDELKGKQKKTAGEIKTLDAKMKNTAQPLEGEAKEKAEADMKVMKDDIKKFDEEIAKLQKRNSVLADPTKFQKDEKDITTQDKLQDDPVVRDFELTKTEMRQKLRASLTQALTTGNVQENMERLGKALGVDFRKINWASLKKNKKEQFITVIDSLIDTVRIEKNGAKQYRLTIDPASATTDIRNLELFQGFAFTSDDVKDMAEHMTGGGFPMSVSENKIVTPFMSAAEIQKEF